MDRLYFFESIQQGVRFEEYTSSEQVWEDMQHMFDNVLKCYEDRYSKEVLTQAVDHMRNLFFDIWLIRGLPGKGNISDFLDLNMKVISSLMFRDEVAESIFNSFKQRVRSYYDTLSASHLSDLIALRQPDVSSEVITGDTSQVVAIPYEQNISLPTLTNLEQNMVKEGVANYWDLLMKVVKILIKRQKICKRAGLDDRAVIHEKAVRSFVYIFSKAMKRYVLDDRLNRLNFILNRSQHTSERRPMQSSLSSIMILNGDEASVYDTPSL